MENFLLSSFRSGNPIKLSLALYFLLGMLTIQAQMINENNSNQGFYFGSCALLKSDTVRYNPFDCGPFKIILVDTVRDSDSMVITDIYVESVRPIGDTIFTNAFLDTFYLENDSAVNIYQDYSPKGLFSQGGNDGSELFFLRVDGGGWSDSIYVDYSDIDLGVKVFGKKVLKNEGRTFNAKGSRTNLDSKYLKYYFFGK